jgi:elongation factor Tu
VRISARGCIRRALVALTALVTLIATLGSTGTGCETTEDPPPTDPTAQPFRMPIDHVRVITGRGTMVTGRVQQGTIKTGDPVVIVAPGANPIPSVVTGLEVLSGTLVDRAQAGDTVGLLLRGVKSTAIGNDHVVQAP